MSKEKTAFLKISIEVDISKGDCKAKFETEKIEREISGLISPESLQSKKESLAFFEENVLHFSKLLFENLQIKLNYKE